MSPLRSSPSFFLLIARVLLALLSRDVLTNEAACKLVIKHRGSTCPDDIAQVWRIIWKRNEGKKESQLREGQILVHFSCSISTEMERCERKKQRSTALKEVQRAEEFDKTRTAVSVSFLSRFFCSLSSSSCCCCCCCCCCSLRPQQQHYYNTTTQCTHSHPILLQIVLFLYVFFFVPLVLSLLLSL